MVAVSDACGKANASGEEGEVSTVDAHGREEAGLNPLNPLDPGWVRARSGAAWPLVVAGFLGVVAGGVVAAMTGPLHWDHGSWAAAYLVLVAGVAQLVLGIGQAWLASEAPARRRVIGELVAWNVGSLLVIGGTLAARPLIVDAGGVLIIMGLVLFISGVWEATAPVSDVTRWVRRTYVAIALVILVSVPIGMVLAARGTR